MRIAKEGSAERALVVLIGILAVCIGLFCSSYYYKTK